MPEPIRLGQLNAMDRAAFTLALGPVFEHSPWVAARAWDALPFATVDELHRAMTAVVQQASAQEQLALLRAHPDLADTAAGAATMSADSVAEQASAGLDLLPDDQRDRFQRLNAAYRATFDFPFIIAVRAHDRETILAAFERRLGHTREQEVEAALAQVGDIARLRLEAILDAR